MPRSARIVIPGIPHHIVQRSNRREDIFLIDSDRRTYLSILKSQIEKYGLTVHGYCLMANHVHLVATPEREDSLAKAIGRTHHLYSARFNAKKGQSGHAWHSRFFSCPLDERHLLAALIYTDRNPVRAGVVSHAHMWPWSSARAHQGLQDPNEITDMGWWRNFPGRSDWKKLVNVEQSEAESEALRRHTQTGRPIGDEDFLRLIEQRLGYPVKLNPVGRPRSDL